MQEEHKHHRQSWTNQWAQSPYLSRQSPGDDSRTRANGAVRVKIITGSLVILENWFSPNYRYRYRLEIRMNFHYPYRLGVRSHPFISIDSQLLSWKSFELFFPKITVTVTVLKCFWIRKVIISNLTVYTMSTEGGVFTIEDSDLEKSRNGGFLRWLGNARKRGHDWVFPDGALWWHYHPV